MKHNFKPKVIALAAGALALISAFAPYNLAIAKQDYTIAAKNFHEDLGTLKPGDVKTGSFTFSNEGNKSFSYEITADPYQEIDGVGTSFETKNSYTLLADWITLSQTSGTLYPDQEKTIYYTIKVPNDVPAGGQYAAIRAIAVPDYSYEGTGVVANGAVAMTLYAKIAGETRSEGKIEENDVPIFLFKAPITTNYTVKNTGNIHEEVTSYLQVFPLFSDEEVYTNEEKPNVGVVLPDVTAYGSLSWPGSPQLGVFKVKQTVKFLNEININEKIVFICPMWFLLLFILFVLFCIYWVAGRSRARKKAAKRN